MGTCDRDGPVAASERADRLLALPDRHRGPRGRAELRIVIADRAGDDDDVRRAQERRIGTDVDADAERSELPQGGRVLDVRARDRETARDEQPREVPHPRAADPQEVDGAHAFHRRDRQRRDRPIGWGPEPPPAARRVHRRSFPATSATRSASRASASGLAHRFSASAIAPRLRSSSRSPTMR